jgi:hypothetical protein
MAELSPFTVHIMADPDRVGRYRWRIIENGKARDNSMHSFATKREAKADGEAFIEKLTVTWQKQN